MYTLYINNRTYEADQDKKLIRFLRDDLHLTSVKDGCSEGACGTCTVIVDGKLVRACIPLVSKMEGKQILTVEGLGEQEKEIYAEAFAEVGAVQCGFCIPGMVLCAKALLDQTPDPSRLEVVAAIKNNICRCTGYKKIVDGILRSAQVLRGVAIPMKHKDGVGVGESIPRVDAREKVIGTGAYVDDIYIDGMIFASALRASYPRARVLAIHTEKAKAMKGVVGVFTAEDIPGEIKVGHLKHDWDTMIPTGEITRYLGDALCIVAAESLDIVEAAKALIEVTYEELTPVFDPFEAMKEDAPQLHQSGNVLAEEHLIRGDAKAVIKASKFQVTNHYETPWTEHAFLEPEAAVAMPFGEGVFLYTSDQGTYDTREECAIMLGIPQDKIIVENKLVGGGFGGKEDVSVQHHAALVAYLTGRIVKVKLTRKESILIHPKRHPMWIDMTTACDANGYLTAMKASVVSDTGAYASLGGPVLQRACTHAAGPYHFQVIDIVGKAVYTNNPPAGAFRGFGVTQTCFAAEQNLNQLAELVGITPWEIRYRNAIRPGQVLPNGQVADASTGLAETLEAVKDDFEQAQHAGVACAMKNAGVGVGIPDWGRCRLLIKNSKVQIHVGASCIGQGMGTVLVQILAESVALPLCQIEYLPPNTSTAPNSGTTSGSRQTLITGEAVCRAARKLKEDMNRLSLEELEGRVYEGEYLAKTDKMGSDLPNPVSHVAYGYATQLCVLNEHGSINKIKAAHAVGKAINPINVEGQIEGGVVMGMGYALTERYELVKGAPTSKFGTLGLFKADRIPELEPIIIEKAGIHETYGAIGIGEITSIPTAPAIAGAYQSYNGVFQTKLPLKDTPYVK